MSTIRWEAGNTLSTPKHCDKRSTSHAPWTRWNDQISQSNLVPTFTQNNKAPSGRLQAVYRQK